MKWRLNTGFGIGLLAALEVFGGSMSRMDHGTAVASTLRSKVDLEKTLVVEVDRSRGATMCYDLQNLSLARAWVGGYLSWPERGRIQGPLRPAGDLHLANSPGWGWARTEVFDRSFQPDYYKPGSLPRSEGEYRGHYLHGNSVVLAYRMGDCEVLEKPGFIDSAGQAVFLRTFRFSPTREYLYLRITPLQAADLTGVRIRKPREGSAIGYADLIGKKDEMVSVAVYNAPEGAGWREVDGQFSLRIPASDQPRSFQVLYARGPKSTLRQKIAPLYSIDRPVEDLGRYTTGGPLRWGPPLEARGRIGTAQGAFAVDTIEIPMDNPWESWIRPTGLDFVDSNTAAVASLSGDVWLVSGLDADLGQVTWKRYATGLFQPLGLKVVDGQVHVLGRDQITRLRDFNGDGEADFYENFNNDCLNTPNYREFATCLETDSEGNFYFLKGAPNPPNINNKHQGALHRVSRDGRQSTTVASGFRMPNGLAIGPADQIIATDNDGDSILAGRINFVQEGGVYGMKKTSHLEYTPIASDTPICWIPRSVDPSPSGVVFVDNPAWGPWNGHLLSMSYGTGKLFHVLAEAAGQTIQGGIVELPVTFHSGLMRGRFNAGGDGHLYVCGMKDMAGQGEWPSQALEEACLQRVRYTGAPLRGPVGLNVLPVGIQIQFSAPLESGSATDPSSYSIEQWNYRSDAGIVKEYSAADRDRLGRDRVAVQSASLSADRQTVLLEIPGLQPVMQMRIELNLRADDGSPISRTIHNSIHVVP